MAYEDIIQLFLECASTTASKRLYEDSVAEIVRTYEPDFLSCQSISSLPVYFNATIYPQIELIG